MASDTLVFTWEVLTWESGENLIELYHFVSIYLHLHVISIHFLSCIRGDVDYIEVGINTVLNTTEAGK